jgi:hypothetical protein
MTQDREDPASKDEPARSGSAEEGVAQPYSFTPSSVSPSTAVPRPRLASKFMEWLLLRREFSRAREAGGSLSATREKGIRRARNLAQIADWVLTSAESASHLAALSLYREAMYWLFAPEPPSPVSMTAVFDAAPKEMLETAAGGPVALTRLRAVLAEQDFVASAHLPFGEQRTAAQSASRFVESLVYQVQEQTENRSLRRLWHIRSRRIAFASLALIAILSLPVLAAKALIGSPDLAKGKPWTINSSLLATLPSNLLFHTALPHEMNPWFEIDLGRPTRIHSLYVRNRTDCCQDRTTPLVAEVSLDRSAWNTVALHEGYFITWTPSFPATSARYVRLRIPRVSALHLEEVRIF